MAASLGLGCGAGAWLRAPLRRRPDIVGVGVDLHPLAVATEHRGGCLEGYRGVLGLASLVLADSRPTAGR